MILTFEFALDMVKVDVKYLYQLFVANNVSSFAANIRKLVNASDNVLINAALRSDLLARSPVFRRWCNILF